MILITTKLNVTVWESDGDFKDVVDWVLVRSGKEMNAHQTHIKTPRMPHFSLITTCSVETGTRCPSDSKCIDMNK